jgi:hypothetical protein
MAKINKHGLKMNGLKKASGATKGLRYYGSMRVQISYDPVSGDVLTMDHIGDNSWSEYHDNNIFTVCFAREKMTMQQIADVIAFDNLLCA